MFFVGLMAQLLFAKHLNWLPASRQASALVQATAPDHTHILIVDLIIAGDWSGVVDALKHLILPAVTLGLLVAGVFIRLVRVNVSQALGGDYVEAARARGIPEHRVVSFHAFRNALVPVVTVMGLQAALLLGGAVLTEQTFNWPGLGSRLLTYLNDRDYIAVQGIITVFALVVVFDQPAHRHRQRDDRPEGAVLMAATTTVPASTRRPHRSRAAAGAVARALLAVPRGARRAAVHAGDGHDRCRSSSSSWPCSRR